MEFTVSKADLVRELNLSQGVVEKKTTIPILSNVLIEANGDRINLTATDLGSWESVRHVRRERKKQGAGTIPAKRLLDYVRLLPDADLGGKAAGQPVGKPVGVRPIEDAHCGDVARKLSGTSANAGRAGADSRGRAGVDDLANYFCDLDGGIALHTQRIVAVVKEQWTCDGGDGRASIGDGGTPGGCSGSHERVSCIAAP